MDNQSTKNLLLDIALVTRCTARLLDQAEPENREEMEAVSVVCCHALHHVTYLSESGLSSLHSKNKAFKLEVQT